MTPAVADQGDEFEPFSKPGLPSSCWTPPDEFTVRAMAVVCVLPPPVPVTTTVAVPIVADADAVRVRVEVPEPGATIEGGLNAAVTPEGRLEADNEIAELKVADIDVEIDELEAAPWDTETADGDAEIEKSGAEVTVKARLVV